MKYRIKIITFRNGKQEFEPQAGENSMLPWKETTWNGVNYKGEVLSGFYDYAPKCDTRKDALRAIDRHYDGNTDAHTIEFEYINK